MDADRTSLARRALAVVVLAVVAVVAIRIVVGVVTGILWMVALAALLLAGLWAYLTLRSFKRDRGERRVAGPAAGRLDAAPPETRIEAEMREIQEQLRRQGRR